MILRTNVFFLKFKYWIFLPRTVLLKYLGNDTCTPSARDVLHSYSLPNYVMLYSLSYFLATIIITITTVATNWSFSFCTTTIIIFFSKTIMKKIPNHFSVLHKNHHNHVYVYNHTIIYNTSTTITITTKTITLRPVDGAIFLVILVYWIKKLPLFIYCFVILLLQLQVQVDPVFMHTTRYVYHRMSNQPTIYITTYFCGIIITLLLLFLYHIL